MENMYSAKLSKQILTLMSRLLKRVVLFISFLTEKKTTNNIEHERNDNVLSDIRVLRAHNHSTVKAASVRNTYKEYFSIHTYTRYFIFSLMSVANIVKLYIISQYKSYL